MSTQPHPKPKKDPYGPLFDQAEEARKRSDYKTALSLYRRSLEDGFHYGAIGIAHMYYFGKGVTKDRTEAELWVNKAAEMGGPAAMCDIGEAYFKGVLGPEEPEASLRWLRKAAGLGDYTAMCLLGLMYKSLPDAKSQETALDWYRKAAETPEGAAALDAAGKAVAESDKVQAASKLSAGAGNPKAEAAKGCFIATAACGSAYHPEVQMLRDYRDSVMARRVWGRGAIRLYQHISPPIADCISDRPWARRLVRAALIGPLAHWTDRRRAALYARRPTTLPPDAMKR